MGIDRRQFLAGGAGVAAGRGDPRSWFLAFVVAFVVLVAAACSSDGGGDDLATLTDTDESSGEPSDEASSDGQEIDPEQAMLGMAGCMRENGIPQFPDPIVDSDGVARMDFVALGELGLEPGSPEVESAVEACEEHIEGMTQAFGDPDISEVEDTLLAFAECMRENGIADFPDPDLTALGQGAGGGGGDGPFGGALDLDDPVQSAALDTCQREVSLPGAGGGA